jgi:hypothetical protein
MLIRYGLTHIFNFRILYTYIFMTHYNSFIYINSFDTDISHIRTQSEHVTSIPNVTSLPNQHNRYSIDRFTSKLVNFNLTHN